MFNISKRLYQLLGLLLIVFGISACGTSSGKVAILLPNLEDERWRIEGDMLEILLTEKGYEVLRQNANNDARLQIDQVDNMVKETVRAIIIVPVDGELLAGAVEAAIAADVKVIAYDRLVRTPKLSAYLSFDNREAGRLLAQAALDALKIETRPLFERLLVGRISGGPENYNNRLYGLGQADVFSAYRQARIAGDEIIVAREQLTAQRLLETWLTEEQKIEAIFISSEPLALGALQAVAAFEGQTPLLLVQEAPVTISNQIAAGNVAFSIFRDRRDLPPLTVRTLDRLIKEQALLDLQRCPMSDLVGEPEFEGTIFCTLLPVHLLTPDNLFDLVVRSGYQAYDDVYREIPDSLRPPRP